MRNALAGAILASTGVLVIPVAILAVIFITHWIEVLLFAVALVIFGIVSNPSTKAVR